MTNFVKITLVSLAVLAGASAANAENVKEKFDLDNYLLEQQRYGS